jgi:2-polyprenyl-3-methyl-5-hydroxy-6-metoxy-1,4-benzoquinol methylase
MKISEEYKHQLEIMHTAEKKRLGYGVEPAEKLVEIIKSYPINTVLDFGCGQGNMIVRLIELFPNLDIQGYDPGVERYSTLPTTSIDLIYSADVLEHIEPNHLVDTLKNLWSIGQYQYHNIACYPAKKKLPVIGFVTNNKIFSFSKHGDTFANISSPVFNFIVA